VSVSSRHKARRLQPHVGFVTESFLDQSGAIFEGGAERHLRHLIAVAAGLGAEVTVYERGAKPARRVVGGIDVATEHVSISRLGRTLGAKALREGCTHLHFQSLERVPWGLDGVPITATAHAVYWDIPYDDRYRRWYPGGRLSAAVLPLWRYRQLSRCLLAVGRCERVLATDTSLLRLVQSHRPTLRDRVEVVKNFTDLPSGDPTSRGSVAVDPALASLVDHHERGHTVVLLPRNLSFVRGGAWLCEIVERTVQLLPLETECHFFLTGVPVDVYGNASNYRRLLERDMRAMSSHARARLHLLGGLRHPAMPEAYRRSNVVLIPTFAHEGTPLAALEALGAGAAVVATNIGGLNDVIEDDVTGLLVAPSPEAVARGIATLAQNPAQRARLGQAARRLVSVAFTHEKWAARAETFARRAGWTAREEDQA
jgi:glycosyltransferase involved in cell wall biosynthesis